MPIYFYWGEDEFAIAKSVKELRNQILDPNWIDFNYHRYPGDNSEKIIDGLNEVMTPPFGMGGRLVWLENTTISQQCSADLLAELQRTLPVIPETSHLLLTTSKKPDRRLKSSKLLEKYAQVKEFSFIPYWNTEAIKRNVRQTAFQMQVKLTSGAIDLLAKSVGNNTRQLCNELEKLSLFYQEQSTTNKVIDVDAVSALVICNTQNSLQLAAAIRDRETAKALSLVNDLINRNEPPLRIVATLVRQFRTWAILKAMWESGERELKTIANMAEIGNPNRLKYIYQEIQSVSADQLLASLPILLSLEYGLKRGAIAKEILQIKTVELCSLF
ncbi:DNA polymerase III, delta subunit [Xenococcus sp. PCC 7305]|uniref:DNA polymerase III subunit delta n=1 Tax=Xenococcus sp. PCC 7305 TaxID=102125 RepID=UPI0002AD0233|nr:DNA polymerase III subunit delta [Xenococcus sp. PCC 7305]ELS02424.1 DNA polymerase III, delta subunit [Xenococcus sp. PCC 7305]